MKRKTLMFSLVGLVALGLLVGGARLLFGAAPHPPDQQTMQEVSRVVNDYYDLLGSFPVWPAEYRHLRKLPSDVKKRIAEKNKARFRELTGGQEGQEWESGGEIFTGGFEFYDHQQIGGGCNVLDLEDIEQVGDEIHLNAIVWSWDQVASTKNVSLPVSPDQVPKSDTLYVQRLDLQKIGGKWKIVERTGLTGLSGPFDDLREVDPAKYGNNPGFGAPTAEEAKSLYQKAKQQGYFLRE